MNAIEHPNIYMRSLATRDAGTRDLSQALPDAIAACKVAGFDLVIVETSGIGQGDAAIVPLVDAVALRDDARVRRREPAREDRHARLRRLRRDQQVRPQGRARTRCATCASSSSATASASRRRAGRRCRCSARSPSRFNDDGVTALYQAIAARSRSKGLALAHGRARRRSRRRGVDRAAARSCPPARARYLAEIAETRARLSRVGADQAQIARERQQLSAQRCCCAPAQGDRCEPARRQADVAATSSERSIARSTRDRRARRALDPRAGSSSTCGRRPQGRVRGRRVRREDPRQGDPHQRSTTTSLSGTKMPQGRAAALRGRGRDPALAAARERARAAFPFTAGVFAFKRENEDPTRMFAGEGDAFRTNRRFHLLADGMPAKRLSTAFDSVTLYGYDPDRAPGHLRQGRQLGRVDRDARRHEGALRRASTSCAPNDLGVDDDQRPGADDPRDVHEHRDRPAGRQVPRATTAASPTDDEAAQDPRVDARDRARHGAGRHPEGGPGPEHLHLLAPSSRSR